MSGRHAITLLFRYFFVCCWVFCHWRPMLEQWIFAEHDLLCISMCPLAFIEDRKTLFFAFCAALWDHFSALDLKSLLRNTVYHISTIFLYKLTSNSPNATWNLFIESIWSSHRPRTVHRAACLCWLSKNNSNWMLIAHVFRHYLMIVLYHY